MKKQLPKLKKSLKSFILEEDAKIINKSVTKIALMVTAFTILGGCDDDHKHHGNYYAHPQNEGGILSDSGGKIIDPELSNEGDEGYNKVYVKEGKTVTLEVPAKGGVVAHANHYNKS